MTDNTDSTATNTPTVEVDGVKYKINELATDVQDLLRMHQRWAQEAAELSDDLNKVKGAMQHVSEQAVIKIREMETNKTESE